MDGILPLWKEKGMTSHDCVFKLRKILKTKKVGHTGTLDPSVEGVLPICIGQATKTASYITDTGKEYIAEVSIGTATETEDADGEAVETDLSVKSISRTELLEVLDELTGSITQIPPMYSAVKVDGRRLYEYARKGLEVERPARKVMIHQISLLNEEAEFQGTEPRFTIRVMCGKGTYIRTLAVQIGEKLGYPAHMSRLVRTASGSFRQQDCLTLREVSELAEDGSLAAHIRPLEAALSDLPFIEADEDLLGRISNGQVLAKHPLLESHEEIVFTESGKAVAVYTLHPGKPDFMKPIKMFPFNRPKGDDHNGNHQA